MKNSKTNKYFIMIYKIMLSIILIFTLSFCGSNSRNNASYDELILKGNNLAIKGQVDKAIVIFKQALKIDDKRVEAFYGLGFSYMRKCETKGKDCERAIGYFDKAVQIKAGYRSSYYNRAICKAELRDYNGALEDINKQISFDSLDPDYYHNRAVYKLFLGDTVDACSDYRKSYELGNSFDKISIDTLCH